MKGPAIGAEQPFVGREHHEIRIETLDVHRQHADAVRGIDEEDGALPPQRAASASRSMQPAVRPVHRRDRGQRNLRRAAPFDHGKQSPMSSRRHRAG